MRGGSMAGYSKQTGWREFLSLCHQVESVEGLDKLFHCYLTLEEQEAIATRCLIVRELLKGDKTQREIAKALQVSIAKITRGSNMLKSVETDVKKLLNGHQEQ
jgi:TrpR family trp operon transcriptional repressor